MSLGGSSLSIYTCERCVRLFHNKVAVDHLRYMNAGEAMLRRMRDLVKSSRNGRQYPLHFYRFLSHDLLSTLSGCLTDFAINLGALRVVLEIGMLLHV